METGDISRVKSIRRDVRLAGAVDGFILAGCIVAMTIVGGVMLSLAWELFLEAWWKPRVTSGVREPIQEIVFGMILGISVYLGGSLWALRSGQTVGQAARNLALGRPDRLPFIRLQAARWWAVRHALLLVLLIHLCIHLYFCFKVHRLSRGELDDVDRASRLVAAGSAGVCAVVVVADLRCRRAGTMLADWVSGLRVVRAKLPEPGFDEFGKVKPAPLKFQLSATLIDLLLAISITAGAGMLLALLRTHGYFRLFVDLLFFVTTYFIPLLYCLPEVIIRRSFGQAMLGMWIVEVRGNRADLARRILRFGFRHSIELGLATSAAVLVSQWNSRGNAGMNWFRYAAVAGWIAAIAVFLITGIVLLCPGRRGLHDRIAGTSLCREQDLPSGANVLRGFEPLIVEAVMVEEPAKTS